MKASDIIPIGLYTHDEKNRCKLRYQVFENGVYSFPPSYLTLTLKKIYYIISPSILPLPPLVKIYYTIEKTKAPYNIVEIRELTDPYDFSGILNINSKLNTNRRLGIFFGAYRKPVDNTVALVSYVNNTLGGSLFLTEERKRDGDWISKFHSNRRIISPIFFLETSNVGFEKKNNICYPSPGSTVSVTECMDSITPITDDIKNLSQPTQPKTPPVSAVSATPAVLSINTDCGITTLFRNLLIITCVVGFLLILISFIVRRRDKHL
jgi:hypothetical protein